MKVELTKAQCVSLIDYIESNLLDIIRNDTDIESIEWLQDLLDAKRAFEKAVDEYENG